MHRFSLSRRLALLVLAIALCPHAFAAPDKPGRGQGRPEQSRQQQEQQDRQQARRLEPQEAAARARARYGGRVLKVTPDGQGYRVRLLQDDGRVINVRIKG